MTTDDLDACLRLLGNQQRRQILRYLRRDPAGIATIEELIDVAAEAQGGSGSVRSGERDRLGVQLSHAHLPMLADRDVVTYDREDGTVQYRPDERIESVLDALAENTPQATF
ncbi:DUF7344 domain-containing protein [Halorubrum trueperi]|uniref:ArsR family transcriptional regulator n=2 Tax=Halorubrum trueperi TaxID=2004704 RepID=A0ABD5UIZ7_9EURY